MTAIIGLIATAAILGGLLWQFAPGQSELRITSQDTHFPTVSGYNLDREEFTFPRDLTGELNILFIPFQQQQQQIVNTWIPIAQETESTFPGVIYYELPTIDEMPSLSRMFVNEGMRAGITDPTARQRTITLYIDTKQFMEATDIPGKDQVHTLLVNRSGEILWRTTGIYNQVKGDSLIEAIQANR